jgi:hypothetical protein
MKWSLQGLVLSCLSLNILAQGTVVFNNKVPLSINNGSGIIFNPGSGSSPVNYVTGGSLTPTAPSGSAADLRTKGFSGAGYFSSSQQGVDTTFSLTVGNGVNPVKAASFGGVTIVPEPSVLTLGVLGLAALFVRGRKSKQ